LVEFSLLKDFCVPCALEIKGFESRTVRFITYGFVIVDETINKNVVVVLNMNETGEIVEM
jgi:hypothetical protein